jgi:hypothetical protein
MQGMRNPQEAPCQTSSPSIGLCPDPGTGRPHQIHHAQRDLPGTPRPLLQVCTLGDLLETGNEYGAATRVEAECPDESGTCNEKSMADTPPNMRDELGAWNHGTGMIRVARSGNFRLAVSPVQLE